MSYSLKRIHVVLALVAMLFTACQSGSNETAVWPEVKKEMHPWARWWWMGSAVDKENLDALLTDYADKGIGGVEITPIYGAKGYEEKYIDYLSPEWIEMLNNVVVKAGELGIGVDMNNGTGWPFGGPQITTDHSARKLIIQRYTITAGKKFSHKIKPNDARQVKVGATLQALRAVSKGGEMVDIFDQIAEDGTLSWSPEKGKWTIYAAFDGRTRQKVKRAAPGGVGYTFDHFSPEALQTYLKRFDEAFGDNAPGVRCFFNDSYEVFGASWSGKFFDEFKTRRGYDLKDYIPLLDGDGEKELMARVKCDYRETMSDMLLEHFTHGWTEWAHGKGAKTRNQSHGSPANLLDIYAAVDIPEIETFGSSKFDIPGIRRDDMADHYTEPDPLFQKFSSSAANLTGKSLVSSETFTWLGEHFRVSLAQCKPQMEQLFISGVNHIFFHGTTYSPKEAGWPGWLFYASSNFAPSNSFWNHSKAFNAYITRCQSVLQTGEATNDMLVYWPVFDIWQDAEGLQKQLTVHNSHEWLFMEQIRDVFSKGYSFDFVSDRLLNTLSVEGSEMFISADKHHYKALIVPECEYMPLETFKRIIELAQSGVPVVMQNWPKGVPGLTNLNTRQAEFERLVGGFTAISGGEGYDVYEGNECEIYVASHIDKALEELKMPYETINKSGLQYNRRDTEKGRYYYIVNHTDKAIDKQVIFNSSAVRTVMMDPMTGQYGQVPFSVVDGKIKVRIQLLPGETCFLLAQSSQSGSMDSWTYLDNEERAQIIDGTASVKFVSGGPVIPAVMKLDQIKPWTGNGDSDADRFSGSATYTINFNLSKVDATEYILDLGEVYETAYIKLNGKEVGYLWGIPFRIRVGEFLKKGENVLEVEVANLMANRIKDMDMRSIQWRNYHEINFVNLAYKPFDASDWDVMTSGLKGPVKLIPYGTK